MNDQALEAALYANRRSKRGHRRIEEPDWASVHRELKRKHVTLLILWDEYIAANPGGYSYSRFRELYRSFEKTLSVAMRQTHAAGERLFVDYAGDGVPVVIDPLTGEIRMAQTFVAVLGASSFTFAKATWTQALPDWIDAHVRAFETIGGVPELVVPGQRQDRHRQGQLLRPPGQSNLRRDGGPLWNRHSARKAEEAARQGESRAGRPDRRAVAARPAEAPDVHQPR
jgi:transposase